MSVPLAVILGCIFALGLTIYICIAVMPVKKRAGLSAFFKKLHDIVNFRQLLVEQLLKIFYTFTSLLCICGGFFLLFARTKGLFTTVSTFLPGLLLLILGPIFTRILYELAMISILLLKNTMEINKRLGGTGAQGNFAEEIDFDIPAIKKPAAPKAPEAAPQAPAAPVDIPTPIEPEDK